MTKQEFTARVNVNVNDSEYEHIEAVYVASDLDKDAFCKLWVKKNESRVKAAKEEKVRLEKEIEELCLLHNIIYRDHRYDATSQSTFTKKEIERLEGMGITGKLAFEVQYEAQKFLDQKRKAA